jgi:formylglycine-generating enzyme required for sulfatase activity
VVPGGTYNRSNNANYPATVSDFRLDTYEITVGRFRKYVAAYPGNKPVAGAGKNPNNGSDPGWDATWNGTSYMKADQATLIAAFKCDATYQTWTDSAGGNECRPMNCITWYEAFAFCIWDGGRLPTEAEWNYAAAGGSEQRPYPWGTTVPGNNANLAVCGCYYNGSGSCTGVTNIAPAGSVSAGNGKWGQADLAGNVWEWVLDWSNCCSSPWPGYPSSTCNNCANFTATSLRVFRGGSFIDNASILLSSYRGSPAPTNRHGAVGARCARSAP